MYHPVETSPTESRSNRSAPNSHESVLPLALLEGALDDGCEAAEEGVLLGLGLRPRTLHARVLLRELNRLRETWK